MGTSNPIDSQPRQISVIIPSYNHANFLGDAIKSVLAQTWQDVEIIVVDDGSTDQTGQVAASFGATVRYIYQSNAGLSAARNTGIRAATGTYIGFLDADDLWRPDFLCTLVPILEGDSTVGAVYCGSQFVDHNARLLPQLLTRTVARDRLHDALINGEFFPPCAVLVRKSVFEAVGLFDERLRASEDWDMWLRVSAAYPFVGIPRVLSLYRMHGDNMSQDLERMRASQLQVVQKHFGAGEGDPAAWTPQRQRAYAGVYLWHALAYYRRGESTLGLDNLKSALLAYPPIAYRLDTFYMLGCLDQPLGYVGDPDTVDLEQNAHRVLTALNVIFSDAASAARLQPHRRRAFGTAFFALGVLAYNQRNRGAARRYLAQAVVQRPTLLTNRQWVLTFAKSCLNSHLLDALIQWKRVKFNSY